MSSRNVRDLRCIAAVNSRCVSGVLTKMTFACARPTRVIGLTVMLALERSRMRSIVRERAVRPSRSAIGEVSPPPIGPTIRGRSERAEEGWRPHPAPGEVVDSVETDLALQGSRMAQGGALPQKVIGPLPDWLDARAQRPRRDFGKNPAYALEIVILPAGRLNRRSMHRRGHCPDLVAQPARPGRPVPADSVFRAVIRRAGVGRDKQLHVTTVLRPPKPDRHSRKSVFDYFRRPTPLSGRRNARFK